MATFTVKGTSIKATCDNAEDLFLLYDAFSWKQICAVNGEELLPRSVDNFAGYTRGFFAKYFS